MGKDMWNVNKSLILLLWRNVWEIQLRAGMIYFMILGGSGYGFVASEWGKVRQNIMVGTNGGA